MLYYTILFYNIRIGLIYRNNSIFELLRLVFTFVSENARNYLICVMHSTKIHIVHSLDEPGLQPYRTLRRSVEHFREGIFVAEGERVVRRLLTTEIPVVSLLLTPEWHKTLSADHALDTAGNATIYVAEKKIVETIVGYNLHQGIMAVAKLPEERPLDETLRNITQPFFIVALDGLANAENVGVVVRNCAAFGADTIIAGKTSSSPYLRRAVRNSMGTVFQMNVVHSSDLQESLMYLRQNYKAKIIAAHPHEQSTIANTDFSGNVCIVLGNEGEGISPAILEACTHRVTIPMMKGTDSLNVASASAVFLYEVNKQRMLYR